MKFYFKDLMDPATKENPGSSYLAELAERAGDKEETILKLLNPLINEDFFLNRQRFIYAHTKQRSPSQTAPDPDSLSLRNYSLDGIKNKILMKTFSKLSAETQSRLIEKDSSLLQHAQENVQRQFLERDFTRYFIYASYETRSRIQWPSNAFSNSGENERNLGLVDYLEFAGKFSHERKTSTNSYLGKSAGHKEMFLNNEMRALCSYAKANDIENMKKTFDSLCLASCERRFTLPGRAKYASDTHSANWLINLLRSDDAVVMHLRDKLDINPNQLRQRFEEIISRKDQIIAERPRTAASPHQEAAAESMNRFHEFKGKLTDTVRVGSDEPDSPAPGI